MAGVGGFVAVAPLRILHLRDTYEIGGPGKTILETHRAIDGSRFALHLGVFRLRRESPDTPFVRAARAVGMPVHDVLGANRYDLRIVGSVLRLVRELDIDIVHAHEVKSDVVAYLAAWIRRVPIMTTVHGWIGNSAKQRAMIALTKRVIRGFDRVIAVSGRIHDELQAAGVPDRALRLLNNAIVLDRYRRTGRTGYLAELFGRPVAGPVIAAIGRISPEKGQMDLVEALGILKSRGCDVSAVFAGDGPDKPAVIARVRALGLEDRVCLAGYIDQTPRLLEETHLLVLPSHTEGLPNVALEALAMNVPVLATRVGGTPEVVIDNETGRLVEAKTPTALADGIADFLANPAPWRAMASRGAARVASQFSFDTRTRRLENIYSELAVEKGL